LLNAAHADKIVPNIRGVVDHEASEKVVGSKHLVDELLWWKKGAAPATTVDAVAERERLKGVMEKGEPVNKGATSIIERDKPGFLGL
jgi:hypothetical protein